MAYKSRLVPVGVKILRLLKNRMEFSPEQEKYYLHKEKGFEGERLLRQLFQNSGYHFQLILP